MQLSLKLSSAIAFSTSILLFAPLAAGSPADSFAGERMEAPRTDSDLVDVEGTGATALFMLGDDCGEIVKVSSRRVYGPTYTCPAETTTGYLVCTDGSTIEVPVSLTRTKRDWVEYTITDYEECSGVESQTSGSDILGESRRVLGGARCPGGCVVTTIVTEWIPSDPPVISTITQSTQSITCPDNSPGTHTTTIVTILASFDLVETSYCLDGSIYNSTWKGTEGFILSSTQIESDDCD